VHLYYDGNTAEGQYGIAYGDTFTVDGLSPGTHSIQAVVAHADHSTTSTRSEPITVHVSESGATTAGAGTSGSSTPAGSGGLGY
jgi:hypothetical protein